MKMNKKLTISLLMAIAAVSACKKPEEVRQASLVQVQQPGDELRDCTTLVSEMNGINEAVKRREADAAWTPHNIVTGKAGLRVGTSLEFIDLSKATEDEIEAYQQRYEYLDLVARRKGCYN